VGLRLSSGDQGRERCGDQGLHGTDDGMTPGRGYEAGVVPDRLRPTTTAGACSRRGVIPEQGAEAAR
jgi:hypothetical protein